MCIENTVRKSKAFRATMIGVWTRDDPGVPALAVSSILNFSHLKNVINLSGISFLLNFSGNKL
jgi:hypothetical protein